MGKTVPTVKSLRFRKSKTRFQKGQGWSSDQADLFTSH